jgi:hypothetical protein
MPPTDGFKNINVLNDLQNQMENVVDTVQMSQPKRPDGTLISNPEELKQYYKNLSDSGRDIKQVGEIIDDVGNDQVEITNDLQNTVRANMKNIFTISQTSPANPMPSNEFANPDLNQGGGVKGGMGEEDLFQQTNLNNVIFNTAQDVKETLLAIGNPVEAVELFYDRFGKDNGLTRDPNNMDRISSDDDSIREPINEFFSSEDQAVRDHAAQFLFDAIISNSAKPEGSENTNMIDNKNQEVVNSYVNYTNNLIKKLAQETHTNNFNLKKEAQHKTLENVLMYGPENVVKDEFTNMPISDWHLVERNKGFGLKVDDIWNINWEKIWRETIMDKYSPPQRDENGNWVGGYIQDRFEVDKNIPAYNNMQLKPGEKRRATPPEYSHTEARLEALRKNKPFNWAKEAASKKKVIADNGLNELPELPELGTTEQIKQPQRWCSICGAKMRNAVGDFKGNPNECPSCHSIIPTPLTSDPQLDRSQKGKQEGVQNNPYIPVGVNLQAGGVFFNGEKFICYAKTGKHFFDSFKEAEVFNKKQEPLPQQQPVQPIINNVDIDIDADECDISIDQMDEKQLEKMTAMHHLAIDE